MKTIVLKYIQEKKGVSFVELERLFDEHGFKWEGSCEIVNDAYNFVYWSGWNMEAIDIYFGLIEDGLIEKEHCHPLIYMVDGKTLTYPLVKQARAYKKPHWCPIVLNPLK